MVDSEGEFIFHSGLLDSDESYTTPPLEIGEYPYFDMVHPWMNGMIIVVEGTDVEVIEEEVVVEEIVDEVVVEEVVDDNTQTVSSTNEDGGGCLIATAAFGSEMAPQVQFLRELRDNTVLQTQAGTTFMTGFNQFYYSFSPAVADYERENPVFKEAVKLSLTPMLTSLAILNYVDIDTEQEMLGYGIGVILLNIGMYFVAPAIVIISLKKRFKF